MPLLPFPPLPARPWLRPATAALLLGSSLCAAAAPPATATAAACDLHWQLTPQLQDTPRQLQVSLSFNPGHRSRTLLRLPAGWQGISALPGSPALNPVADDATLRSVDHAPGQRVTLRWQQVPASANPALRLDAQWLALAGQAVLPVPEDPPADAPAQATAPVAAAAQTLCVSLAMPTGSRHMASAGTPVSAAAAGNPGGDAGSTPGTSLAGNAAAGQTWQFSGAAAQVQQALFAGGALQVLTRQADGQALQLLVPANAGFAKGAEPLADAAAASLLMQRRFWRDKDSDNSNSPPLQLLLLPAPTRSAPEAASFGRSTVLLSTATDQALPSAALDAALAEALLRQRLPDRLGPLVHAGRRDEALRAWLGEGLVAFYSHRLLLRSGAWTPEDYAAELNRRIERYLASPVLDADNLKVATGWMGDPLLAELPGQRGEWLSLHWHAALRAAGQPGLDGVLRKLMLPAAQARHEGPLSSPLATHRLLAALRHTLGDTPLRDLTEHIDRGTPFAFAPGTLGPCFKLSLVRRPEWRLGFDRNALSAGVVSGVEPGGPAEAAGLRDGMAIRGYRVVHGDVAQPVWLQVLGADGQLATVSYTAAGSRQRELPQYAPVAQALQQSACQGWLGQSAEADAEIASARGPGGRSGRAGRAAQAAALAATQGDALVSGARHGKGKLAKAGKRGGKAGKASKASKASSKAGKTSGKAAAAKAGKKARRH
jgi:hypothetical protein